MNLESSHIENMEGRTEQELINQALENDRKKLEIDGFNPDVIKAASILACGKRFGEGFAKEQAERLF